MVPYINGYTNYSHYINDVHKVLDSFAKICPCTNFYDINFYKINDELCSILDEMANNSDDRYIKTVMNYFNPKVLLVNEFNSSCHGFYSVLKDSHERGLISNFLKFYMILKGYQKGDLANFHTLISNVFMFEAGTFGEVNPIVVSRTFKDFRLVIDNIVGNKYYLEMANSNDALKKLFYKLVRGDNQLNDIYEDCNSKLKVFDDLSDDPRKASLMFDKMMKDFGEKSKFSQSYFYSSILKDGERFEFVNSNLIKLEGNYFIRKSIFSYIKDLNSDMFNELNQNDYEDSFINCMSIVFNSDSYFELLSKLRCLNDACKLYCDGSKKESFECLKNLDSLEHKKRYNGEVVSYSDNSLNMVEKPDAIFRREKELYSRIDSSISYEFMEELHHSVDDVDTMISETDSVINKTSLVRFIKRKVNKNRK